MPIYEYGCNRCQHEFEELVRSQTEEVRCPKCDSPQVTRRMSAASFKTGSKFSSSHGSSCSGCSSSNCGSCH
jgi:putative FmdB family regulatory protein